MLQIRILRLFQMLQLLLTFFFQFDHLSDREMFLNNIKNSEAGLGYKPPAPCRHAECRRGDLAFAQYFMDGDKNRNLYGT